MPTNTATTPDEQAEALAALDAELNTATAANRARVDALIPAALECADADEITATRRLFDQFTDEQLWDLGKALMALSVGRGDTAPGRTPGTRTTSTGRLLAVLPGGAA